MNKIKIIEIASELGAGTRGASMGIDALKVAAAKTGNDFFLKYTQQPIQTSNYALFNTFRFPHAKYINEIQSVYDKVCESISESLTNQEFPVILAGDHSSAGGTIAGIKKANPELCLGVIWIDAHADIHSPYTTHSGNMHGMPLATALAIDNLEEKRNEIDSETKELWEKLKDTGNVSPKILGKDIVMIGVRDTEPEEDSLIQRLGITHITVDEIRKSNTSTILAKINETLNECDIIYCSFDVDSLDSELVSAGTGTPVPGGLSIQEAQQLLTGIAQNPKLVCFEMVEINPTLDNGNKMAEVALDLLDQTVRVISKNLP